MMIHPDIYAALTRERSATLMAQAAAARRARPARPGGEPPAISRQVLLRDGSPVLIRPVRSTDAPLLADGFARLTERSRRLRFLGRKNTLTEADLRYYQAADQAADPAAGPAGSAACRPGHRRTRDGPVQQVTAASRGGDSPGHGPQHGAEPFITNDKRDFSPGIKEIDVIYPDALPGLAN